MNCIKTGKLTRMKIGFLRKGDKFYESERHYVS